MMFTMSAGFLRWDLETASATEDRVEWTGMAGWPLVPWTSPNSTRAPGFRRAHPAGRASGADADQRLSSLAQEAEALVGVVPLDLASRHGPNPCDYVRRSLSLSREPTGGAAAATCLLRSSSADPSSHGDVLVASAASAAIEAGASVRRTAPNHVG